MTFLRELFTVCFEDDVIRNIYLGFSISTTAGCTVRQSRCGGGYFDGVGCDEWLGPDGGFVWGGAILSLVNTQNRIVRCKHSGYVICWLL